MIDLVKHIKETHRESNWQQGERNQQQPAQPLIPSPQSPTEIRISYDPRTGNLQQDIARLGIVGLENGTQTDDGRGSMQIMNASANECKINIRAAFSTLFSYVASIIMVIHGAFHLRDCPAQNLIPIFHIIMGCLWLFLLIINNPQDNRDILNKDWNTAFDPRIRLNFTVQIAIICTFFALCYWTFHINPDTVEGSPNYCEEDFYRRTYNYCTLTLSIFGLRFVLKCCGF